MTSIDSYVIVIKPLGVIYTIRFIIQLDNIRPPRYSDLKSGIAGQLAQLPTPNKSINNARIIILAPLLHSYILIPNQRSSQVKQYFDCLTDNLIN